MDPAHSVKKVLVCVKQRLTEANPSCGGRGGAQIRELLEQEIALHNITICVAPFICFGLCDKGPNVRLAPNGKYFHAVTPQLIPEIVQAIRQFVEGNVE
jgi:(2Fe-2S) ferredoxin